MTKIISTHSFRGGTGKSNVTANIAAILAQKGYRVGVFDTDIQSPGIHIIFHLTENDIRDTLNDYLGGIAPLRMPPVRSIRPTVVGRSFWFRSHRPQRHCPHPA